MCEQSNLSKQEKLRICSASYTNVPNSNDEHVSTHMHLLDNLYTVNQYHNPLNNGILKILQFNASGLSGKCEELLEIMLSEQVAIAFVSETWLKPGVVPHECVLHSFTGKLPESMVTHQHHGLAIVIHPYFLTKVDTDLVEVLHVEQDDDPTHGPYVVVVKLLKQYILTFNYLSPSKDIDTIIPIMEMIFTKFPRVDILLGDFNMRLGSISADSTLNRRGKALHELFTCRDLTYVEYQNVGTPTFHTLQGSSIVDLFYVSPHLLPKYISCRVLDDSDIGSDHLPCILEIYTKSTIFENQVPVTKWKINKLKIKTEQEKYKLRFSKDLGTLHSFHKELLDRWIGHGSPIFDHGSSPDSTCNQTCVETVELMSSTLETVLLNTCRDTIGRTKLKKKTQSNWFLDKELRKEIHTRRKLYDIWKHVENPTLKAVKREHYIKQRKLVQDICQRKRKIQWIEWTDKVAMMKDTEVSKITKCMLHKRSGKYTKGLDTSDERIAEYSNHFKSQSTNNIVDPCRKADLLRSTEEQSLHGKHPPHTKHALHQSTLAKFVKSNDNPLKYFLLQLKEKFSEDTLNMLSLFDEDILAQNIFYSPRNKAPGSTCISLEMLLHIRFDVAPILSILFTVCFLTGYIPQLWRSTLLCPIFKKGDSKDINNYRPISLTETIRKLYETAVLPAMLSYIEPLTKYQNGFRSDRNTIDHVATLQYICQTVKPENSTHLCLAFLDIKSAYDKVNRSRLWSKLADRGAPSKLINVAKSLFDYNTSQVVLNNKRGESFPLLAGLLQGSIISPMLYSLYIDDLATALHKVGPLVCANNGVTLINCLLYADDIVLIATNYKNLQALLLICERHAIENDYLYNPKKCEVLYALHDPPEMYNQAETLSLHGIP